MKKVLHITEAFGGGVQTALYSYVHSSRSEPYEHSLLARARSNDMTNDQTRPHHVESVVFMAIGWQIKTQILLMQYSPKMQMALTRSLYAPR